MSAPSRTCLIVYLQARSCLTSQSEWKENDGEFWNCHKFAVSLFELAYLNADWCDELLSWWNKCVASSCNIKMLMIWTGECSGLLL